MAQNNRRESTERKGGAPKRYDVQEDKRCSDKQPSADPGRSERVNADRNDRRACERENDLYERQSI